MKSKKMNFIVAFFAILLVGLFIPKDAKATEVSPNLYLGIQEFRQNTTPENMAYGIKNPDRNGDSSNIVGAKIWKIVRYNSSSSTDTNYDDTTNYYCVKAGVGFANTGDKATYDVSYNFKTERDAILARNDANLTSIVNTTNGTYYKIMALADLLYIPGQSSDSDKAELLSHSQSSDVVYTVRLTDDDIDAVQQAAIWYFTNYDDSVYDTVYNQLGKDSWLTYKAGTMSQYTSLSDYKINDGYDGEQREAQAITLYNYLINTAVANASKYQAGTAVSKSTITLYTNSTASNQQPVIEITKEKEFDLALRKYITKVGSTVLSGANSRVPDIDESTIATNKTATYKHKKDPVLVNTGDVVTYNLTIYNEGDKAGRATQIIDQLPTGLQFSKINTAGFTATADNTTNRVTITRDSTNITNLPAYSTGDPASETIEIECIVTQTKGDEAITLTNVAWISQEYDAESNITITNQEGADRDSEPTTTPNVNKDNMSDYKGTTNQTDLSQNIYYPGQQDDDDFEKLILPAREKEFDLALRKYITKVGNTVLSGTASRVPDIDESTIATTKTATYKHKKDPILVKTGDVVTYNLTIYNEGEKAGRATKIVDQLPTGLQYSKINTAGFTAVVDSTTNRITITRDTTNTTNLPAYTTGDPASETIEIECKVIKKAVEGEVILTNVAWISEEYDAEANKTITNQQGADRDSEPSTTPTVDKDSMSDYKGTTDQTDLSQNIYYPGEQDDDDFEKLRLVAGEFDLALRKYITKVGDTVLSGTASRVPDIDESTIVTNKTATYKHKKDPVLVKTGDVVTYNLTIYNEGEKEGRATKIIDQLPTGLEFSKINTAGFTAVSNSSTNRVTITRDSTNTTNLPAYTTGDPASETIEIECIVTKKSTQNSEILTNVAWISEEYDAEANKTITNQQGADRDSEPSTTPTVDKDNMSDYKGTTTETDLSQNIYYPGQQDDDDFEKLILQPGEFDLKLIKSIVEVNSNKVPERIESVDVSKLNTLDTNGNRITTATYNLNKTPVAVEKGDIVKYRLRIYNEGEIDGYAAEISEDIPEGLEFIWSTKSQDEIENDTTMSQTEKEAILYNQLVWGTQETNADGKVTMVKSTYLAKGQGADITETNANLIKAFDGTKGYVDTATDKNPDYKEIYVYMRVISDEIGGTIIRNEAAVTDDRDSDNKTVTDRDSQPENWPGKDPEHKYQDDEDYDNIILQSFDLSLRKFIIAVSHDTNIEETEYLKDEKGNYTRAPQVDTSKLNTTGEDGKTITTAIYNHPKEPVVVDKNDVVIYMLRVYNEGQISGYATEIKDYLPEGLDFVEGEFNTKYGWKFEGSTRFAYTDYLKDSLIKAAQTNSKGEIELDYKEVPIMCKLNNKVKIDVAQTNIAEISADQDEDKKPVTDRDSQEDRVEIPNEENKPTYKDDETGKYIPGQQDDDDFEKIIVKPFDLALRKFITQVEKDTVNTRIPQVKYDKEKDQITYEHTKDPVDVVSGNTVVYTIRVFNEGARDGYAAVISDDMPAGLEFLPENETNTEYRWKMYRKVKDGESYTSENALIQDGVTYVVTTKVEEAEIIATDYLSKEQGEARMEKDEELTENPALLKAFKPDEKISDTNPDYKDVKVAFKVVEPNTSDKIIVNSAQIAKDTDKDGNEVDDDDSIPGKWNEGEDDQDKEYIKLNYFDLALRKWVTQAIVIENGKETITQTGHTPDQDPEPIVKVDLHRKKIDKVTVKFRYSIRITNQGDIAGYAKEIKDYVPQGLKFVAADNPGWTDLGNNVISTNLLADKLLQPGESADVEVLLTWINGNDNIGLKTNIAEISKDYNDKGVPDKDSTPDNKKDGEDDIDDAPVMLAVATGLTENAKIYIGLGFVVLITIAGGIVLIKKFVI